MLIIHAGMHKTGSTSIQWALSHRERTDDAHYFRWTKSNHSNLFLLLFEDAPESYFSFRNKGVTPQDVHRHRQNALQRMRRQISATLLPAVKVFSAERIATAPDVAVERMRDFFVQHFNRIAVHAYVRPPVGYLESMFQQSVKTGQDGFHLRWPGYRRSFERLDRLFGRENVHLRPFRRELLKGGDVVSDFTDWIGLAAGCGSAGHRNESMSAVGLSLTAAWWQLAAERVPSKDAARRNRAAVAALRALPGPRFALNRRLVAGMLDRHARDLAWIDARLGAGPGQGLGRESDLAVPDGATVFSSDADLLAHAEASVAGLGAETGLADWLTGLAQVQRQPARGR